MEAWFQDDGGLLRRQEPWNMVAPSLKTMGEKEARAEFNQLSGPKGASRMIKELPRITCTSLDVRLPQFWPDWWLLCLALSIHPLNCINKSNIAAKVRMLPKRQGNMWNHASPGSPSLLFEHHVCPAKESGLDLTNAQETFGLLIWRVGAGWMKIGGTGVNTLPPTT